MEPLTWTGSLGTFLNPLFYFALFAFAVSVLGFILLNIVKPEPAIRAVNSQMAAEAAGGPSALLGMGLRYSFFAILALIVIYLLAGLVTPYGFAGIVGEVGVRFTPVWIALVVTFVLSIIYKRKPTMPIKLSKSLP